MNLTGRHIVREYVRANRVAALVVALGLACAFCGSCSRRPKGILSEKETVSLITDMTIAETYEQSAAARELPDSVRRHLGEIVMRQHGIDQALFDSTMAWYGRNLDDYVKLYAQVDKNLQKRLKSETGGEVKDLDSDDIWMLDRHYWFTPLAADGSIVFEIPGDGLAKGEGLEWTMSFNSTPTVDLLLGVDYTDGTSSYVKRTYRGDRKLKLTLLTDTALQAKRIFGTMHVDRLGVPAWVDSIHLVKHPFDSTAYSSMWSQKRYFGPKRRVVKTLEEEDDDRESGASQPMRPLSPSSERGGRFDSRTGPGQLMHKNSDSERPVQRGMNRPSNRTR